MTRRYAVALAVVLAGWEAFRRWRPREMRLSGETLADIARREDTAGLGEKNDKDAHPFAVERMSVLPQNRSGVDPRFARGRS